jgi:RimJ/RimL family protein N-acetyltransferase
MAKLVKKSSDKSEAMIIETNRLQLSKVTKDDASFILALLNTPLWIKFIGDRGVRTVEDAQKYIQEKIIKGYEDNGFGMYIIKLKNGDTPIGLSGLVKRPTLEDVDIGYALFDDFTGKGYAFEATKGVYNYGKTSLGLKRIVAIVNQDNKLSIKLLEKLGFYFEKMIISGEDELRFYANVPPSVIVPQITQI